MGGYKSQFYIWLAYVGFIMRLLDCSWFRWADWIYGKAVAFNPKEKFGNGNIKGVIGPEGANNAQKATSMITTVIFGLWC